MSPIHVSFIGAHRSHHHFVDRPHGRAHPHLAALPNPGGWSLDRRRLALFDPASLPARATVGEHCTIPQTHPMAVLLHHGPDVPVDEDPLCGQ